MFYRAFWGLDPLTTPDGRPTQALHGFLTMVNGIIKDRKPDFLAFALESGNSWRKELDPTYKGTRTEPNADLTFQLDQLPRMLQALNYPVCQVDRYEADDVIGTLAEIGKGFGWDTYIVSSDKDFCQLVCDKVKLYDHMKGVVLGTHEVIAKYGVFPEQFVDYLAIVGDSSDNIPGVAGIGAKGAQKLLQQFSTLEAIYENVHLIKGASKDKLIASKENAFRSKILATIANRIPAFQGISESNMLANLTFQGYNQPLLKSFLEEFGLRKHLADMLGGQVNTVDGFEMGKRV
jgi:DNA polymerase-1